MKRKIGYWTVGALGLGLSAVTYIAGSQGTEEPRAATVADIMSDLQQPAMKRLTTASKAAPVDDKGWNELRSAAALLNESGFLLIQGGRSKDDVWTKTSADLRAATGLIAKAAEAKDFETIKAEIPKVTASCKECHEVHQ